jgi:hypothetical protein
MGIDVTVELMKFHRSDSDEIEYRLLIKKPSGQAWVDLAEQDVYTFRLPEDMYAFRLSEKE